MIDELPLRALKREEIMLYVYEVRRQAVSARLGLLRFSRELNESRPNASPYSMRFSLLYRLLQSWGNFCIRIRVRRTLNGIKSLNRGRTLRQELGVRGQVLENRKVRDAFEHIDERLDDHIESGALFVDHIIGDPDTAVLLGGTERPKYFRLVDTRNHYVWVLDAKVHIPTLSAALEDVYTATGDWLEKAGWPIFD